MTPSLWLVLWLSMTGAAGPPAAPLEPAAEAEEPAATVYATTTVRERPVSSATAAVTVLEREAIEASAVATVQEALAFVPGVTLVSGATRGGLTAAQIRGGDTGRPLRHRPRWSGSVRAGWQGSRGFESYETLIGFPGAGRSGRLSLRWTAGGNS